MKQDVLNQGASGDAAPRSGHPGIPIIFSAPMVRALLAGRKTMTRRIIKPQPVPFVIDEKPCDVGLIHVEGDPRPRVSLGRVLTKQEVRYAVDDRLYVREGLRRFDRDPPTAQYIADITGVAAPAGGDRHPNGAALWQWKQKAIPSIHMPRWASRLTLIVIGIKVERLQDISEDDARAEGVETISMADVRRPATWTNRGDFAQLWNKLHGAGAWDANPFVVAISFRVIRANIDAPEALAA